MTSYSSGSTEMFPTAWSTPQLGTTLTPLKVDPIQPFPMISGRHYWVPVSMPISTPIMMSRAATAAVANAGPQMYPQGLRMDPTLVMPIPIGLFSQLQQPQSQLPAYAHTPPQAPQPPRGVGPSDTSTESCASLALSQPPQDASPGDGEALTPCPRAVRKNGLLYATNTQYEGHVKRYSHLRGFGFLTATHRLAAVNGEGVAGLEQCESVWQGGEDASPAEASETVVEIDGARYLRRPVRIGDIFVHYQKIRVPLDATSSEGLLQNFTVGARVYFRADWGTNPGSLQAVDVRLLPRTGRVLTGGGATLPPYEQGSLPIGPPLPPPLPPPSLRPASLTPTRPDGNTSWESSELEFLAKHSLHSGQSNGGTSISKLSTLGESDGAGHPVAGIIGIPDIILRTISEGTDDDESSFTVSPRIRDTDLTNFFTTSTNTVLWI